MTYTVALLEDKFACLCKLFQSNLMLVNVCIFNVCVYVLASFDWRERRPPLSTSVLHLEEDLCPHYAPTGAFLIKRWQVERWTERWQNRPHVHYVSGYGTDSFDDWWRGRLWRREERGKLHNHGGFFPTLHFLCPQFILSFFAWAKHLNLQLKSNS